jgi:TRAP-type mannitol/chloroaromatic compound transport system permease small subunit
MAATGGGAVNRLLFFIDEISTWVGKTFAWCIVALTLSMTYEVCARYGFGAPTEWAFDASYMLYGALFMMAGAYTLARNGHVRGDFLYRTWRPRTQATVDLVLYIVAFFPGILAFVYAGYGYAKMSWLMNEHSSASPNGPPVYHFKALIPITGVLMLLQGLAETVRCVMCIFTGRWPPRLHDVEELENVILEEVREKGIDETIKELEQKGGKV